MAFNEKRQKVACFCIVLVSILNAWAAAAWDSPLGTDILRQTVRYLCYGCDLLAILCLLVGKERFISVGVVLPISFWLITCLFPASASLNLLMVLNILPVFLLPPEKRAACLRFYRYYLIASALIGLVCYASISFRWGIPYTKTQYYFGSEFLSYYDFKFCYIYSSSYSNTMRLCGLFNEPGYFGTILAIALCADRMNLRHVGNIVLLAALFFSFSLGGIVLVILFAILNAIRNEKAFIALAVIVVLGFLILPNIEIDNPNVVQLLERFSLKEGTTFGDSRSTPIIDEAYEAVFRRFGTALFGFGGGYSSSISSGFLTYKSYVIDYGILGFALIFGLPLWFALRLSRRNYSALVFVLVFFASVYQRPNVYTPAYFVLLVCGVYTLATRTPIHFVRKKKRPEQAEAC